MNIVIGAGISGLSAGQALKGEFVILEKCAVAGGLAGRYQAGGHAFDYGGHYFHFQGKPEIKEHVEQFHGFRKYRRDSKVFLLQRFIPYSLQYHLSYLPVHLRRQILTEMAAAPDSDGDDLETFLLNHFGRRFYDLFFSPFLGKFYGRSLSRLVPGMDKGSIPIPNLAEVTAGAKTRQRFSEGYNPVFYYPDPSPCDFIETYSRPVLERIRFQERVIRVEPRNRKVFTTAGAYSYDNLISTLPLKELLGIVSPPPPFPRHRLRHISTLVVNVVLARRRRRFHWLYLPERCFPFYRVGYYPASGTTAVYLEKTLAAGASLDEKKILAEIAATLRRAGMIAHPDEILFHDLKRIPVSYIVFDRNWRRLVPEILSHLRRQRIHSIGRYGGWNYSSMADDILMARETADRINGA